MSKFHPAYGVDDETRRAVLRAAEDLGVPEVARLFNFHVSAIYKWRKRYFEKEHRRDLLKGEKK